MLDYILRESLELRLWVFWMMAVNLGALFFIKRVEARWALAGFICAAILMETLVAVNGYNRLLGTGHLVFWTPAILAIWRRRAEWPKDGAFPIWVKTLLLTNCASLIIDAIDVVRYVLGDRG